MNFKNAVKFTVLLLPIVFASLVFAQGNQGNHRAAFEACIQELGLKKPQPGQRPSQAEFQKVQNCLSQKGIALPQRPPAGEEPSASR